MLDHMIAMITNDIKAFRRCPLLVINDIMPCVICTILAFSCLADVLGIIDLSFLQRPVTPKNPFDFGE